MDVTERRRTEDELQEAAESLALAQHASSSGVWDWHLAEGDAYVSPEYRSLYGLAADEPATYARWLTFVHPDDRERLTEHGRQFFAHGGPEYDVEFRMIHPERGERWIAGLGRLERDAAGQPTRFSGINIDITDRKRAEDELRHRSMQLETLLNRAPLGVYLVDADFRIAHANPVALPVLGDLPDLVGQPFDELLRVLWPASLADELERMFRHTLETGESHHDPSLTEARADRGVVEHYDWRIDRITLPDGRYGVVCYFSDISDQVRSRQAVAESEERYRTLFDSIDEGFCVIDMIFDEAGKPIDYRFAEVNSVFEQQTGLREVLGRTARELVPGLEQYWFDIYGRVAMTGEPIRFTNEARSMSDRWFDVYAFRLGGPESRRLALLFNDVSEQKRAEQALAETQDRLRSALDAGAVGTWTWDPRTEVTVTDAGMATFFGVPVEEAAAGTPRARFFEAIHPEDRPHVEARVREAIATGERYEAQYRIVVRDGVSRWVQARGRVYRDSDGRAERIVGSIVDITRLKEAEAGLREREALLESALRVKDEFLGLVSHELRTPMTIILGMSRVLGRNDLTPGRMREMAQDIADSAEVLNELVEGMLLLARLDQDEAAHLREPVLLHRAAEGVVGRLRSRDGSRQYLVDVQDPTVIVEVQLTWLERVIENLLTNAAKYGGAGTPITVVVDRRSDMGRLLVLDHGPGVAPTEVDRLFEPFYRAPSARKKAPGAGLGLAVARRIVELLGGRIWASTRPEGGAEFGFELPAAPRQD
jgi:PAS domain S-box-containing protein